MEDDGVPNRSIRLVRRQLELQLVPHAQSHANTKLCRTTIQLLLADHWFLELRYPCRRSDRSRDCWPLQRLGQYASDEEERWYQRAGDAIASYDPVCHHHVPWQHRRFRRLSE